MELICKTCKNPFKTNDDWKTQCYQCWQDFKGKPRIEVISPRQGVFIAAHPDVTKEEIDAFIEKQFGCVNTPSNWGGQDMTGKRRLWFNNQNMD